MNAADVVADVDLDIDDDDLVAGCVVIVKVVQLGGEVTVCIGSTEGMSWLEQLGLVTAAHGVVNGGGYQRVGDDD